MAINLGALASMMGGGGLPAFPCAVCTVELADVELADDGVALEPATTTTVVLGTPVCDAHAVALVGRVLS